MRKQEKIDSRALFNPRSKFVPPIGSLLLEPTNGPANKLFDELFRGRDEVVFEHLTTGTSVSQSPIPRAGVIDSEILLKFRSAEGVKYNRYRVTRSESIVPVHSR